MAALQPPVQIPLVEKALCLRAAEARVPSAGQGIGVLVINYNTASQTLRCLESLRQSTRQPDWVLVLDNASNFDDYQKLLDGAQPPRAGTLCIYRSEKNLGFAEGSNVLIDLLLNQQACQYIMLLNNDAVAQKDMLAELSSTLEAAGESAGLAGGRMHKLADPSQVDTLGIALYASLMPADRQTTDDIFVGPTGGCCMLTRPLLEQLKAVSGYYFDPRFFCYCEDTDLVLRSVMLGYRPLYLDKLLALHEGQASSGGGYNEFIAYHGLRNALWMQIKLMPAGILLRYGILLLMAHLLMIGRHTVSGRITLMLRVYRDAARRFPELLAERRQLTRVTKLRRNLLAEFITPRFYRRGYFFQIIRQHSLLKNFIFDRKI